MNPDQAIQEACDYAGTNPHLQLQCSCYYALQQKQAAYEAFAANQKLYNQDLMRWNAYDTAQKVWQTSFDNYKNYLNNLRAVHYQWTDKGIGGAENVCTTQFGSEYQLVPSDVSGGSEFYEYKENKYVCQLTQSAIQQKIDKWKGQYPQPVAAPSPAPVPPFDPGSITCCSEVWSRINASGAELDWSNIKQQCTAVIQQNINNETTISPSPSSSSLPSSSSSPSPSPSSPSSPSSSSSPSPTSTSSSTSSTSSSTSSTTWFDQHQTIIIIGIVVVTLFIIVGIILFSRSKSDSNSYS